MIAGYPERPTVFPGERLTLRVSTSAPRFSVEVSRQGTSFEAMPDGRFGWFDGVFSRPREADTDFDWEPYELRIPAHWPSGAYVAIFTEGSRNDRPLSAPDRASPGGDAKALFVVRGDPARPPAPILCKLPLFAYHARDGELVSLQRPGGGAGAPREHSFADDAPLVARLESGGYAVEYCTDLDVHERPATALARHRLIVSAGRDECWTDDMRRRLEDFVGGGGRFASFAPNPLRWRLRYAASTRTLERLGRFSETIDPFTGEPYRESAFAAEFRLELLAELLQ